MSMVLERALAILELNHAGMNLQEACDIVGVQVNSYTKSKSVLAKVVPDKYVRIFKHFTQEEIDDVINESKRRGVSLVQVCDERDINYQTLTTRAYSLAGLYVCRCIFKIRAFIKAWPYGGERCGCR